MPAVTRKGDADVTHCSTPFRLGASENVFVNKDLQRKMNKNEKKNLIFFSIIFKK